MKTRKCSRCHEIKPLDSFPPSHTYCRPCFAEYNRDRFLKRKAFQAEFSKTPLVPMDPPKPKPERKSKPVTDKALPKPVKPSKKRSYAELIQPPKSVDVEEQPETVEQFLARGGKIQHVPSGKSGCK